MPFDGIDFKCFNIERDKTRKKCAEHTTELPVLAY